MNAEVRPVPSRVRPFEGTQLRRTPFMKLMMGRDPAPTRDEYDELVEGLSLGDKPMDELIDWLYKHQPGEGHKMFKQALAEGVDSVANAPQPLRDFFAQIERTPAWLDRELLEEGVAFIHRCGLAGPYVLRDFALMGGYLLSGFNHALVLTGALNRGAAQRIAETGKWWIDCTETDGMQRFGAGFKTTIQVRLVHGMVRRHLPKKPEWDNDTWGLPVNQTDMLATYLAFGPIMLVGMRAMGIPVTPHESKAVMHLWKYVGWVMGVQENWLVDGEREGLVRLYQTFLTQSKADWTSAELGRALSQEPLERQFSWGKYAPPVQELWRKLFYHKHLSNSSLFLNSKQMKSLGLPADVLPWFPLLTMGPRFASYSFQRFNPLLKKRLERQGRKAQLAALKSMWGNKKQDIINPNERHPAHAAQQAKAS